MNFGQTYSKEDEHSSLSIREKSSSKLVPSIVLANYSAIGIISINDVKRDWESIVETYWRDVR